MALRLRRTEGPAAMLSGATDVHQDGGDPSAAESRSRTHRLAEVLRAGLDPGRVITDATRLRTYECDGITGYRVVPAVVALPETTEEVALVVRACAEAEVPFVARGAGTGLSGGALP